MGWRLSAYQIPLNPLWIGELGFVLIGLWSMATAIRQMNFNVLFILIPFTLGYALVLTVSILQSRGAKVRADG
jgi:F0F1-type ATP synthase assembly protein I